jgi:uncharacterized protein YecE (DUF72 family)
MPTGEGCSTRLVSLNLDGLPTTRPSSTCLYDRTGLKTPEWVTGPIVYVRFHGSSAAEGRYTHAELTACAKRIRGWLAEDRQVYIYFNNDAFGHAVTNARELRDIVSS